MSAVFTSLARALGHLADASVVRVLLKSIAITLAVFVAIGWAINASLPMIFSGYVDANSDLYVVVSTLLAFIAAWVLFRIVALAVLQFFADEVVIAVERKSYPEAAQSARALPFREDLSNSLRGAGRTILANVAAAPFALMLLVTAIGPAILFWAVNAVLLGRELHDMAWLRHRHAADDVSPVGAGARFALGGAIAALMIVPFINLLAPVLGAAAATHLVQSTRKAANAA